jgi:ABC-type thiamin/hydroxymethylpyrimidine transport system permease subunit
MQMLSTLVNFVTQNLFLGLHDSSVCFRLRFFNKQLIIGKLLVKMLSTLAGSPRRPIWLITS